MRADARRRARVRTSWAVCLAAAALPLAARGADDAGIAIQVPEPSGIARRNQPVTTGVPLPRGALQDPERAGLTDAGGRAVPLQAAVLERWPDGSVRWLLLDFLADVVADGDARYVLRLGIAPAAATSAQVQLERTRGGVAVDTGPLRFSVPDTGTTLATDLRLDGRAITAALPLPGRGDTGVPSAAAPRIETRGPIRTEWLLTGRWPDGLAYEARLAAFAGSSALRLRYTVTHAGAAPEIAIDRLTLAVAATLTKGALGLGSGARSFDALTAPHALRLADAREAHLDGTVEAARPDCWVSGTTAPGRIVLVSPLCWQQYPQAFIVTPGAVRVDVLGGAGVPVHLGRGAAKTHELWIVFEPATADRSATELAVALAAPVVAHVDPAWVVRTAALPGALAPDDDGAGPFLQHLRDATRRYRARAAAERWDDGPAGDCDTRTTEHPRTGFYGTLNWGDWNFPGYHDRTKGCDAWGNLEYDLPQVLGLGWVATGGRPFWDTFAAAALHYRDVDIIHHDPEHPDRIGLNHPHKVGHFDLTARQNVDLGHAWLEGLLTHYRLTGDVRSRTAALAMGDALAGRLGKAGNPRQFGWPMIALAALAEATGEPRYRDAAVRFAGPALTAYEPTPDAADWKIGILADGLAAVERVAPDTLRMTWLRRYADALLAAPPERHADPRLALPLGPLAAWTGDRRYRDRALAVAAGLEIGDWGKALALGGRIGFRLLGPLAAPPIRNPLVMPARAAPRPPSARAPPRR